MKNEINTLRGKSDKEILDFFKRIARDTCIQKEIFEKYKDSNVATKVYKQYRLEKGKSKNNLW